MASKSKQREIVWKVLHIIFFDNNISNLDPKNQGR